MRFRLGRLLHGKHAWNAAALLAVLTLASIGCNPIATLGYLVYPFFPNNNDPLCPLTIPDKESKVVIICAHEDMLASDPIFRDADEVICRQLIGMLTQRYKENKDKVQIVPVTKVYSYLRSHPEWLMKSKQEIGKQFEADYLVYLELGPMTMFEPGNSLYRGRVEVHVTVFDVCKPEGEGIKYEPPFYTCLYPTAYGEDRIGMSPQNFRAKFLEKVAKDLTQYFAVHPTKDKMGPD